MVGPAYNESEQKDAKETACHKWVLDITKLLNFFIR